MQRPKSIRRRQLLSGASAALGLGALGVTDVARAEKQRWQRSVDVVVAGTGAGGVAAAIEAAEAGASVLMLEALGKTGGSSAMSGGVVYAGGGTALQKALGVVDTREAMVNFITHASGPHPDTAKIQRYCDNSPAHFDWLVRQGVPYKEKLTHAKGLPFGDESLYYSGNELAWPSREYATPAMRGHVPGVPGMNGGRALMEALLARVEQLGIPVLTHAPIKQLVSHADNSIAGIIADYEAQPLAIRARRGVVLACGGFIHNRPMLKRHAPQLYNCSVPWGNAGDLGQGIQLGMSAGGEVLHMHEGFAIAPIYPPEQTLSGILLNEQGQRFISEESYHGVIGHHIAYNQGGKAWLVLDKDSDFAMNQDNFPKVAQADSIDALFNTAGIFPAGAAQQTLAYYNEQAQAGADPLFHKSKSFLRPLNKAPFYLYDISVDQAFFPAHTFGGLHTSVDSEVINASGEAIPGLYAAGRNARGLPVAPYIASGMSVGDCTFFGRMAGRHASKRGDNA